MTSWHLIINSITLHGEVFSIQHYVIKFCSDLLQVGGFLGVYRFPPPIKQDITEILLKVKLNTLNHKPSIQQYIKQWQVA